MSSNITGILLVLHITLLLNQLLSKFTEIEHRIKHGEMITDSEFSALEDYLINWDENHDGMRRLHIGIKKTFKEDVTCGAGMPLCLSVSFVEF
jgi:hypothetical protein